MHRASLAIANTADVADCERQYGESTGRKRCEDAGNEENEHRDWRNMRELRGNALGDCAGSFVETGREERGERGRSVHSAHQFPELTSHQSKGGRDEEQRRE